MEPATLISLIGIFITIIIIFFGLIKPIGSMQTEIKLLKRETEVLQN